MTEVVNPVIGTSTQEALAAAQTVFADTRINWSVVNSNAAEVTMDLVGISASSGQKVVVKCGARSVTAFYQDRNGATIQQSRPLNSVGAACADLKRLLVDDNDPFTN